MYTVEGNFLFAIKFMDTKRAEKKKHQTELLKVSEYDLYFILGF